MPSPATHSKVLIFDVNETLLDMGHFSRLSALLTRHV